MKESDFRNWLCKKLREEYVDCQPIESSTGAGIPDVNCCHSGVEFWLELKMIRGAGIELRPTQFAWMTRRQIVGGLTFVVAYHISNKVIYLWDTPIVNQVPTRTTTKKDFNIKFILG